VVGNGLFADSPVCEVADVAAYLDGAHYLGRAKRGFAWSDEFGVLVLANPSSRRLPHDRWLELIRWCLTGERNGGSRQWSAVAKWLRANRPEITTVVSYSDPSVGHTGALYKACNWIWAPTWHRLRPPPSGNGMWREGAAEAVKDRWVFPLQRDPERERLLAIQDASLRRRHADAEYRDPVRFR
jgi:hypothetical protein